MTIKSILCIFGGLPEELNALNVSLALAELHQAQVRFLHISPNVVTYASIYGDAVVFNSMLAEELERENSARLNRARQYVSSFAARHHVTLNAPDTPRHHAAAHFVHRTGIIGDITAEEGRMSDMIVVSRGIAAPEVSEDPIILAALFDTGRPLLLLPVSEPPRILPWQDKIVAVAWDGSLQAANALRHAMPYVQRAEALYIVHMKENETQSESRSPEGLSAYLRAHGITAPKIVMITREGTTADTLLEYARKINADLLITGAYGHSRFREMIFGGTTRQMIEQAHLPLLMMH